MNVGELRATLDKWPDNMEVAVINDQDLDGDIAVSLAFNHPSTYMRRKSWHWEDEPGSWPDGDTVLVIY